MNFTHLEAFFAVVKMGSVTAASEHLHVSQPALTREIRELEERFGVVLFDRLPRGMKPTEAGVLLAQFAAQIFTLANSAENAVGEFAEVLRGDLRLAASRTIGVYFLPKILDTFRRLYPGVTIDLAVTNTEQVEETLLTQERQVGFIEGTYDIALFDAVLIGHDEIIPVVSPSNSLYAKGSVSAAEIGCGELVVREAGSGSRAVVEQSYAQHGLVLAPKLYVGSTEAIKQLLLLGNAVAWISQRSIAEELANGSLVKLAVTDLKIERDFTMIWRKSRGLSPSAGAFRTLVKKMLY
ncbi:LysR family transcriptional regulator [Iodobacter fluviatilis]|jgi:DNA-binding transcriptional LysR family regulator|uniref:LysR family transcriptional regulator n=1 Tax=Iodobacter fluviatilis TaxID=537 RepID=A0A7G3GCL6_9NEIS|nr:LysR family transcriptional regulator [Iodobacter fluviatilis]QBC44782.1 LysR family transcriptional regulator [Iodobacter fluviatilis]